MRSRDGPRRPPRPRREGEVVTAETFWFLATCVAAIGWMWDSMRASAFKAERDDAREWKARIQKERDDHRLGELRAMERVRELEAWIANPPKAKKGGNDAA